MNETIPKKPLRLHEAVFAILLMGLVAVGMLWVPVVLGRGPITINDLYEHNTLCQLFADSVLHQWTIPQWLQAVRSGLGGPNFLYYPPLYSLSVTLVQAVTGLEIWPAMRATDLLYGWGIGVVLWLCLRRSLPERRAVACALTGQLCALPAAILMAFAARPWFAATPLIILCIFLLVRPVQNALVPQWALTLAFAFLVLMHIVSALMMLAIASFILACFGFGRFRKPPMQLAGLAIALALGLGLTAFYWLPAMVNSSLISPQYWHLDSWKTATAFPFISRALGTQVRWAAWQFAIPLSYAGFLIATCVMGRLTNYAFTGLERGFTIAAFAALFLSSEYAYPLYELFPPLTRVQFPYRFISPAAVCVSIVLAMFCWETVQRHHPRIHRFSAGTLLLSFAAVQLAFLYFLSGGDKVPDAKRRVALESASEYLPASSHGERGGWNSWVDQNGFTKDCERMGVRVLSTVRQNHYQAWDIESPGYLDLRLPVFQFPAWVLIVDGKSTESRTDADIGVIVASLHPGFQRVELRWTRDRIWLAREGVMISIVSCFGLVLWVVRAGMTSRQTGC